MSRKKYQEPENTFGARLRRYRKKKGLKGGELAVLLDISQSSLSAIENNKTETSSKTIGKLLQHTDINVYWLYSGEGEMTRQMIEEDNRSSTANLSSIDKKHAELILNFKDKATARQVNQDLLTLEADNPDAFREAVTYIKGLARGVQLSKPDLSKGKKTA